jgi:hypothetical protein
LGNQVMLVELLLSAFFAVSCFRARAESPEMGGLAPQKLFVLTDRIERLRRSRWQWCSMVALLIVLRMQSGSPVIAELTVLAQFIVFMSLPAQKPLRGVMHRP